MLYEHEATVEVRGAFPVDMLRYDRCHPASGEDAHAIAQSLAQHPREPYRVVLKALGDVPVQGGQALAGIDEEADDVGRLDGIADLGLDLLFQGVGVFDAQRVAHQVVLEPCSLPFSRI